MNVPVLDELVIEAKSEISEIDLKLEALQVRREALVRFVNNSEEVKRSEGKSDPYPLNGGMRTAKSIIESAIAHVGSSNAFLRAGVGKCAATVELSEGLLWRGVQTVMQLEKRPMTVPEIQERLTAHKIISVGGNHPRENIRSAITRKEDVFEKITRGLYVLREWPDRIKRMRQDEPLLDAISPIEEAG